jgi:hypothetical protein
MAVCSPSDAFSYIMLYGVPVSVAIQGMGGKMILLENLRLLKRPSEDALLSLSQSVGYAPSNYMGVNLCMSETASGATIGI